MSSGPAESKTNTGLVGFFQETRIKWDDFPPSCTIYLASLTLSLIYSHLFGQVDLTTSATDVSLCFYIFYL